jgi:hypothetical protein
MNKYCLSIFLTLLSLFPVHALAASPPSLAAPAGLSLAEIKITGNEFILLMNNTGTTIPDLSKYWLYDFNNTNPLASGVSSSTQQLPPASLANGQTALLSANGGPTCGAAVTAKLSISLTDGGGFLEIVQTSLNASGALVQTTGDAVSWSSGANPTAGMIANVPSSSAAPNGAFYRIQNGSVFAWQSANQDTTNTCQLNVTIGGVTTAGPVNPGNQLPGSPPAAIFVTDDSLAQANSLPPSDVGLAAPVINELLPNPADPKTDSEDEFIEIYNSNDQPFDISGFKIQTGTTTLHTYTFPSSTLIPAKSFTTYYSIDTNLSLSNSGGQVRLLDPAGSIISQTEVYPTADDGQAWALADGKWYWTAQPTPGATNIVHQPLLAKPYTLTSTTAKTTTPKTTKTTAPKTAATKKTSTPKAATSTKPASKPGSLHPFVLAAVGILALGYAAYEYRHDLHNRLYQLRRYRTVRRTSRLADNSAVGPGAGRGSRRWQNQLGGWLGTRLW